MPNPHFPGQALVALTLASALSLVGCRPPVRSVTEDAPAQRAAPVEAEADLSLFASLNAAVISSGAPPLQWLSEGVGVGGDSQDALLFVPEGRCALVAARGGRAIADLDLHVFDERGALLGVDERPDETPTVLVCPDQSERLYVSARIVQGKGPVLLAFTDVAPGTAAALQEATGARTSEAVAPGASSWPTLESAVQAHRTEIGGSWVDQRRVPVPVDARVSTLVDIVVPAQRCTQVLVLPGRGVGSLELEAQDRSGRGFARGQVREDASGLLLCAGERKERVSLSIRPQSGRGIAALTTGHTTSPGERHALAPEAQVIELGPPALPEAYLSALSERLGPPSKTVHLEAKQGQLLSWTQLWSDCQRLDIVPPEGLAGYIARLYSADGLLLAHRASSRAETLFTCHDGEVRLDLRAERGSGKVQVQLRKVFPASPPLLRHPLAASELLAQTERQESGVTKSALDAVRVVELHPQRLTTLSFEVPLLHCLRVAVALGRGPAGLDARLVDAETGMTLDAKRGTGSLALQACGDTGETRQLKLELRSLRDPGAALIVTRQSKK